MLGFESDRDTISDSNGGVDWLNFSAIAADLQADLAAGGAILIGGQQAMTLGTVGDFENFFAGDGDDSITGNRSANHIEGARGIDTLHGGNGNDSVVGGTDNDKIYGDRDSDTLAGGDGNDRVNGGTGTDLMTGGRGNDVLVFQTDFGADTVRGFQDNLDTLKFNASFADGLSVAQFIATYATVTGGNTVFDFGGGEVLVVVGVANLSVFLNDISFL